MNTVHKYTDQLYEFCCTMYLHIEIFLKLIYNLKNKKSLKTGLHRSFNKLAVFISNFYLMAIFYDVANLAGKLIL